MYAVYLDGMALGSVDGAAGPAPVGTLRLGRGMFDPANGGDEQFYGFLDDVAVFTRALSATEVTGLATAHHLTGTEPDLLTGYTSSYVPPGGPTGAEAARRADGRPSGDPGPGRPASLVLTVWHLVGSSVH